MRRLALVCAVSLAACAPITNQWNPTPPLEGRAAAIMVTPQTTLDRDTLAVGVLDFHTDTTDEDKGFDELRIRAAELGADAVVAAQFEHGEEGERSHLSGIAVRYCPPEEHAYEVIGPIDIATEEDADDKGFDEFLAEGWRMGADEIQNVQFDHGEEGGMSHIRGVAVRFVDR